MTSFGNRVLADDQVKTRSLGWALIQRDWRPYEGTEHTEGKQCGDTGGRWPPINQGTHEATRS